jgi:general secretion pathway protein F
MKLSYRAYDATGRLVTGNLEGTSKSEILARLKAKGLFPFETSASGEQPSRESWLNRELLRQGLSLQDRAQFCRMLAALLSAGVPVDRSLQIMSANGQGRRIERLAKESAEAIASGLSLSSVLAKQGSGFARHETGLIASAEQTGAFAPVLDDLSAMLDKRIELRGRLGSALVYPIVLLVMAIASLVVIGTVLVPSLAPLFSQDDVNRPLVITAFEGARDLYSNSGYQMAATAAAVLALAFLFFRSGYGRKLLDRALLKFLTMRQLESARICRTLSTLLKNGIPLQSAIRTTADVVKYRSVSEELTETVEKVVGGGRLSSAFETSSVVDRAARQLIAIGEETNRVEDMLLHIANTTETSAARRLERAMTLLTPLMTVALGLLIGGLIMSVMRAILSVNELAQ